LRSKPRTANSLPKAAM